MTENREAEWPILLALWMLTFAQTCQFLLVVPILGDISRELGMPLSLGGTLISAYGITSAFFSLISGPISDRVGRRRVLLVGTALMATVLLMHPLATSYAQLLVMRALTGVASGVLSGAAVAYVGDYFPYERRGAANGIVMSGLAAGQIAGIPAGTLLAKSMGFSAPFVVFGVVLLMVFTLIYFKVPQPNVAVESRLTIGDALRKYVYMFSHSDTLAATTAFLLLFIGVSTFISYMPTWLEQDFAATPNQIALMYGCGGTAALIFNPIGGRISDRWGRRGIIIAANTGMAFVTIATPFMMFRVEMAYVGFFLAMTAGSLRMAPLQSLITAIVGPERRGTLLGLTSAAGSAGFAIGGAVSGLVYAQVGFTACAEIAAVAVTLGTLVIWRFLPEPHGDAA